MVLEEISEDENDENGYSAIETITSIEYYNTLSTEEKSKIKTINISNQNSVLEIFNDAKILTNLRDLIIDKCNISSVPKEIGLFQNLELLQLSYNNLTENSFPEELWNLESLTELFLFHNSIKEIPPEIKGLKNLYLLDVSYNVLRTIPKEIGDLKKLNELDLSMNGSIKEIPQEIGKCLSLEHLTLSGNNITKIPDEIRNLKSLISLNLYGNFITKIPSDIGYLLKLKELDLSGNFLKIVVPDIGYLVNLKILNLSSNNLTQVPKEMWYLEKLYNLDISNNKLTEIPSEIRGLQNLNLADFSNNQLMRISPKIKELKKLEFLNISKNKLPLIIPEIFEIEHLENLDISYNPIEKLSHLFPIRDNLTIVANGIPGVIFSRGGFQGYPRQAPIEVPSIRDTLVPPMKYTGNIKKGLLIGDPSKEYILKKELDHMKRQYTFLQNKSTQSELNILNKAIKSKAEELSYIRGTYVDRYNQEVELYNLIEEEVGPEEAQEWFETLMSLFDNKNELKILLENKVPLDSIIDLQQMPNKLRETVIRNAMLYGKAERPFSKKRSKKKNQGKKRKAAGRTSGSSKKKNR